MNNLQKSLKSVLQAIQSGQLKSFVPLLNIFTLRGQPLTLDLHYQFAPLFNVVYPKQQMLMTGRQVGKTWQLAGSSSIRAGFIPYYDILHIEPRDQQRMRYQATILRPLIESSPLKSLIIKSSQLSKVLLKQFNSGSFLYLGTAYVNADALRGISGCSQIIVDEMADIDYEFIPVIREVMSASLKHGYSVYAGTPTTTDTTCGILWSQSSQAQWIIKCPHCSFQNIPNPQQHLLQMLSQQGLICSKCGKEVSPRDGSWIHAIQERALTFPGYHISQTVHPLHLIVDTVSGQRQKWRDLMSKVNTYSKVKLFNEVFGWPYDESINPLTLKNLIEAQHDIKLQTVNDILQYYDNYRCFAIGVDWDGGGALSESFTSACIAGLRNDSQRIDILYGKRWPKGSSPSDQAYQLMRWIDLFHPDLFAHDNTGAGFVRMQIMKQAGLLYTTTTPVPFTYTGPKKGDIVTLDKAQQQRDFYNYTLDKSRSLALVIQTLKDGTLRIPKFNVQDTSQLAYDFLALKQDPRSMKGSDVVLIGKKPGVPDDFAHAVNFAVMAIFQRNHCYPVLGERYNVQQLAQEYNNFSPRSEFARFTDIMATRPVVLQPQEDPYG